MSRGSSDGCGCVLLVLGLWAIAIIYSFTVDYYKHMAPENKPYIWVVAIGILSVGLVVGIIALHNRDKKKIEQLKAANERLEKKNEEQAKSITDFEKDNSKLKRQADTLLSAFCTKRPFSHVAAMIADVKVGVYGEVEQFLKLKRHPAYKSAQIVSEMKAHTRVYIDHYKEMEYKYDFLLSVFPELKKYVDDEEELLHLSDFKGYDAFSDSRDRVEDWITSEEYRKLSVNERNQLALDRYKKRNKSKWEIGMEYELYVGYVLRKDGFFIKQFGIENGLNDLGRDIIAEKAHLDGTRNIYIIQCKNWSKGKELHENVVCQLFGTTLEYQIQHREFMNTKIIPLLVTTTRLSNTAEEFAKRLGVVVKVVPIGDYPMIKCNIDSGIYHLPFDQQYYTTKIVEAKGEKYVWTVAEARALGYRRAMKWSGN